MYLYDNKQFKDLREIHSNYDLISIGEIMKSCGASVGPVSIALNNLSIKPEIITLKPSGRTIQLYQRKELPVIAKVVGSVFQNDVIPDNYISKREFAVMFGVKPYTVNNMSSYFKDFDKYAKYYFVDNIKTKFYLINEETKSFYKEKVEKYTTPFSKRKRFINTNLENNREYSEGNLHKIAFDYEILAEIFDTNSRFFHLMIKVYKKYAKLQIADSSIMDCHHIIPRFYSVYANTEDFGYATVHLALNYGLIKISQFGARVTITLYRIFYRLRHRVRG